MNLSHPRKNIKISGLEFAYAERAAGEDGEPSATAYIRSLIHADRIARARREAGAVIAEVYARHPGAPGPSDTEFLRTAVRLYEFLAEGEVPVIPKGLRPRHAARLVLAQLGARIIVDGAAYERATGDSEALKVFLDALAADERVHLGNIQGAAAGIGNILAALVDLLGERALAEATSTGRHTT